MGTATRQPQPRAASKKAGNGLGRSGEERAHRIAEAAYYLAQQRGFSGGDPLHDWLEAERMIDAQSTGARKHKQSI